MDQKKDNDPLNGSSDENKNSKVENNVLNENPENENRKYFEEDQTELDLKKDLSMHDDIEPKASKSKTHEFIQYNLIIMFFMNVVIYIPLIVIFKSINNPNEFKSFWWVGLVGAIGLTLLSISVYFSKRSFLEENSILAYVFFPIFIILFMGIITLFSLYNFLLCFSINLVTTFGFIIALIMHFIPSLKDLNCFKITIIYMFLFGGNILFISFQKDFYVEFFTITVLIAIVFTYIIYKMGDLLDNFFRYCDVIPDKQTVKIYFTSIMIMLVHMVTSVFRDK